MYIPVDRRIARLKAWFNRENERPLIGFFIGSQYPLHRYNCENKLPAGEIHSTDIIATDFLSEFERLFHTYEDYGGDLIWSSAPFWGIPWIEASLGCHIIADHFTGSTHTLPPDRFQSNHEIPDFNPDNPWIVKMIEFIYALNDLSNGRFPVGMTLLRGVSDLLSALYGGENFIFSLIDVPEEVEKVIRQLEKYWISFCRYFLEHLPEFYGGTGSFYYGVWTPGKTVWFQEDASALLSPELFDRFIYPSVINITRAFKHSVIHLHPSQLIPVDQLLKTEVSVIELHKDIGGPEARDLYRYHRAILGKKPLIIWGDLTNEDLDYIHEKLPAEGLLLIPVVRDKLHAKELLKRFVK